MKYNILTKYNFTPAEIEIFDILLSYGELTVTEILEKTELSRTSVHDALNSLLVRDLVTYKKEGRNAYYTPVHPSTLYSLLETKKQETQQLNAEMEEVIRSMIGSYNVSASKPGVRFFEGMDGIREVFDVLLTATEEIYTYADVAAVQAYIPDINAEYVKKRKEKKQTKKILAVNIDTSKKASQTLTDPYTEIRLLPSSTPPFATGMNIFDNKIVYLTLTKEHMIGVIIEDPHIYTLHRETFKLLWDHAKA